MISGEPMIAGGPTICRCSRCQIGYRSIDRSDTEAQTALTLQLLGQTVRWEYLCTLCRSAIRDALIDLGLPINRALPKPVPMAHNQVNRPIEGRRHPTLQSEAQLLMKEI